MCVFVFVCVRSCVTWTHLEKSAKIEILRFINTVIIIYYIIIFTVQILSGDQSLD